MPVTYKDFDKDVKDQLTKKFQDGWKIECKAKGPKEAFYVNPIVDKGVISADVQYDLADGTKTKVTIDQNGNVKDKVTYTQGASTVEVTAGTSIAGDKSFQNWDVEATHELKEAQFNVKTGVTYKTPNDKGIGATVGVVYDVTPVIAFGLGVGLSNFQLREYSAGVRYATKGFFASAVYLNDGALTVSGRYLVNLFDRNVYLAAQARYGQDKKSKANGITYTAGVETDCLVCKGAKVKVRFSPKTGLGLTWIKKLNDLWEAAVTIEQAEKSAFKVGVLFTRE